MNTTAPAPIPEALQRLKAEARARAEAARQAAEDKAAAEAEAAGRLLLDALTADLPLELMPYLAAVDGADAARAASSSREYIAELLLPGHRPLAARYLLHGDVWTRAQFSREGPDDYATASAPEPLSRWRVVFESERTHRYYHNLGAALAAAETDDPDEWAIKPTPSIDADLPF